MPTSPAARSFAIARIAVAVAVVAVLTWLVVRKQPEPEPGTASQQAASEHDAHQHPPAASSTDQHQHPPASADGGHQHETPDGGATPASQPTVIEGDALPEGLMLGFGLYVLHCSSCHGPNLQGAPNWQAALPDGKMPPPPLNSTGHGMHHGDAELFAIIKGGMESVRPDKPSDMPAFGDKMSDDDIRAVLAFLKSTW